MRLEAKAEHVGTIFLVVLHMQPAAIPMYALLIFDGACHAFLAAFKAVWQACGYHKYASTHKHARRMSLSPARRTTHAYAETCTRTHALVSVPLQVYWVHS